MPPEGHEEAHFVALGALSGFGRPGATEMTRTVAVVDYGMGNLRSVSQAVKRVAQGSGFEVIVTAQPDEVIPYITRKMCIWSLFMCLYR